VDDLAAIIKENFRIEYEGGASVGTAYLLWLIFGFVGIHRFYLRQHNATSYFIWLFTCQLFGLGWVYDGFTLWDTVDKYNKKLLNTRKDDVVYEGFTHLLFGFKLHERPSMIGAYLLWFFAGFIGAHRWYTGYHTTASSIAWTFTYQIWGIGWLYDAYYTAHMVNHPKYVLKRPPFYIKVHDGENDYVPVNTNDELAKVIHSAYSNEKVLRLVVTPLKNDSIAYTLWFFLGIFGAHAWYLGLDSSTYIPRFCTLNYFSLGWIVEGINMDNLIDEANTKLATEFIPSLVGRKLWPLASIVINQ